MTENTADSKQISLRCVGIVGGGIAGLYTALLLKRAGIQFHILEGTHRAGGRVHTHYFSTQPNQYYEAGAMRIPDSIFHKITFDLINYVNAETRDKEHRVQLIDYILNSSGNELFINGYRSKDQVSIQDVTPAYTGWSVPPEYENKSVGTLMKDAIGKFQEELKNASHSNEQEFEKVFRRISEKLDNFSFRYYLLDSMNYPTEVIDFMETVLSQTNQFALSVPELLMQNLDFDETEWKSIKDGMSRLPEAMARVVGLENITFGARVSAIRRLKDANRVEVVATGYNGELSMKFDAVVLAIPPAALKMLVCRPRWGVEKEMAIRSIHYEPLYKMGMRFKTRFWETCDRPSFGGQSTTDLPIRWIVFPSYGLHDSEKHDDGGVLLIYAWMTDATTWAPLTPFERRSLALENLEQVYKGRLWDEHKNPITVTSLLIETSDAMWSSSTATGDAMFLPGQFLSRFDVARRPEEIFFAGEHLSFHHTWISGAADSALKCVRDMLHDSELPPLRAFGQHDFPDSASSSASRPPFEQWIKSKLEFVLKSNQPLFPRGPLAHDSPLGAQEHLPRNLGGSTHTIGADINCLQGMF